MAFPEFMGLLRKRWALALIVFAVVAFGVGFALVPQAQLSAARVTMTATGNLDAFADIVSGQVATCEGRPEVASVSVFENPKTHAQTVTVKGKSAEACREAAEALAQGVVQAMNERFPVEGASAASASEATVAAPGKRAFAGSVLAALALALFAAACAVLLAGSLERVRRSQPGFAPMACYYAAFFIYVGEYLCEYTTLSGRYAWLPTACMALRWVSVALLAPKFITQRYTPRGIIAAAVLVGVGVACFAVSKDVNLLLMFCFIAAGQDVDVKVLAKILLVEEVALFVVLLGLSQTGFIESLQETRGTAIRYALGYSHPNRLGAALVAICCAYAVIRFPKIRVQDLPLFAVAAAFAWFVPVSRTATLVIGFAFILFAACSFAHGRRGQRVVLVFLAALLVAFAGVSFYAMVCYDPQVAWQLKLNDVLSNRLALIHEYFLQYPRTLFGIDAFQVPVSISQNGAIVIDNAYARAFLTCGIVPAVVFLVLYVGLFVWAVKNNRLEAALIGACVYALVGLSEWHGMHFALNYCLVSCAAFLLPKPADTKDDPAAASDGEAATCGAAGGGGEASASDMAIPNAAGTEGNAREAANGEGA